MRLRPWYSDRSQRWHGLDGRFLAFSEARPRGGVFEPGEADLSFEMFGQSGEVSPAKAAQLARRRGAYHRKTKAVESNTLTGRAAA